MPSAFLPKRAVLSLSGEETIPFLQGLISNDANLLAKGQAIYAALLSPQGKFQHDFFLVPYDGKIYIDVSAQRATDLLAKLKIYRLRSKVELALESEYKVAVLWDSVIPAQAGIQSEEKLDASFSWHDKDHKIYPDPRLHELGYRAIVRSDDSSLRGGEADVAIQYQNVALPRLFRNDVNNESEYEKFRLSLGVPDTLDMIVDRSLLLECGFEELHGVDFGKGCYVGQEVTARSKFRGQVRKGFYKVSASQSLPVIGTKIEAGEKTIGEMRSSLGGNGIAIINNEEYEAAQNNATGFSCGGIKITVSPAEWLKKI